MADNTGNGYEQGKALGRKLAVSDRQIAAQADTITSLAQVIETQTKTLTAQAATLTDMEQVLADTRAGLTAAPVPGAAWDSAKGYMTGDTATDGGVLYVSARFNRGKQPSLHPGYWETVTAPALPAWADIEDGAVITEGTRVTHDGAEWLCTAQHIKSTVYKPKAGSSKWEKVA